ncbi:precorrin-2 C(20)-methyltransferase [Marivibrio halodurans]|uniref:Precorrin-2 C(20)-methyltransferase n=1 Tax=Marivibrio halodurans TaxID=2039722 RepID=A0A8J7S3S4_9PROT|nr:precorrin-2 C(20)-methyltransferase [Marivibrio halodurans]MBP5858179.1 precorrin-2 C(20)-methyltransferase [Marivibrio halodurans]
MSARDKPAGTLFGLGVGPGDPELLTLKAARILREAPVIAYPAPLEGDSMARRIAAPHIPEGREEIAIRMPMVPARFPAQAVYDEAAETIGAHLTAGRDVAVLCEGDPFFYGSFMYLFARLAERFRTEVVPGVSALTATAAAAHAPLAARNDVLTVLPGPLEETALVECLARAEAVAIIKVGRHLAKVKRALAETGLAEHARYISHASMAEQRVLPLADLVEDTAPYFSMILAHRRGTVWSKTQ